MQRDIRGSDRFDAIQARVGAWLQVGTGNAADIVDPALSPDGRTIAGCSAVIDKLEGMPRYRLVLVDTASGELEVVTDSPRTDRAAKWSPDGRKIAFISDRETPYDFQVQVMDVASRALTEVRLKDQWVEYALWSPDGRRILIGAAGTGADMAGAQGGYASPLGKEEAPDWAPEVDAGVKESQWRSAWIHDLDTGESRKISPAGMQVWEAAWCGDDAVICVATDAPGEETWYRSDLRRIDLKSAEVASIYTPSDQIGWISASPAGARVSFSEAVCSDRTIVAGNLFVGGRDGGFRQVDTAEVDVTFTAWQGEDTLLYAGHRSFESVAGLIEGQALNRREIWSSDHKTFGDGRYPNTGPSRTPGDFVAVVEGFFDRPVLTLFEGGRPRAIRAFGPDDIVAEVEAMGSSTAYRWTAPDGLEIQGWLIQPGGPGPHPLVMDVHGGPVWCWRPRFLGRTGYSSFLARAGYAVFYPNVRGSAGRGQDYARRVFGDMGGADTYDYLSGLDKLVAGGIADPTRLGVTGGSYGGFMSSWLITQDDRFTAAAPIAPVTDWVSEHLTCHIPHFCEMFLDDVMTNPDGKYFSRSPIMFANQAKTPSLNICGALDHNTPAVQALEFHHALLLNGVESVLVTYPQEGHGVRQMPALFDFCARLVGWFEDHMPARARVLEAAE